ncbi:MAG: hypothetical protein ACRC4G_04590 [Alphaproteobacteria bacterium]
MSKFHPSKFRLWILVLGLLNADVLYATEGQEENATIKAFNTAMDKKNSLTGSSSVIIPLEDLFEKKKWDLLVRLLNASEKQTLTLSTKKISDFVYNLEKTNIDTMKRVLEALKSFRSS